MLAPTRPMEEELRKVWNKPFGKSSVAKDLPRLAARIVIEVPIARRMSSFLPLRLSKDYDQAFNIDDINDEVDKLEVIQEDTPPSPSNTGHQHIRHAITEVARTVETVSQFQKIKSGLDATRFDVDLEMEMRDLFSKLIGEDSKTAKVFKAITQNVLFAGCVEIKTKVPMHTMTKDVRGPEGWRILVSFTNDTVSISHFRREQSLATAPDTEQFWFEWRLCMIFDRELTEMQSSSLKITNLGFGENCSGAMRASLSKALGAGNLLVS